MIYHLAIGHLRLHWVVVVVPKPTPELIGGGVTLRFRRAVVV
jgi:hypothetical protein